MTAEGAPRFARRQLIWPMLCVFALFMAYSLLRMPVPAPNEPHYLAKAKHYWDATYCPGDFFLNSANTHLVFYQTFGWVTRFLTLEQTAVAGRIVSLLLLACGWTAFARRLIPGRWGSLWTAAVFLAIEAFGNFSGEWVVGGVESKVFSYAFVFLGLAAIFDHRWILTGLWLGLAVSFHPVVGIWAVAAVVFAGIVLAVAQVMGWRLLGEPGIQSPRPAEIAIALAVFVVTSLPGLVPAFELIGTAPEKVQHYADFIVVSYRLKHHLDPMDFSQRQFALYRVLLFLWIALEIRGWSRRSVDAWFRWFVLGAVLIAFVGLLVGMGERPLEKMPYFALRMKLMKFYPFRLADVFIPVGCAIALVRLVMRAAGDQETRFFQKTRFLRLANPQRLGWLLCVGGIAFALIYPAPASESNSSRMSNDKRADWIAACDWIAANAPDDALFLTPTNSWAFKWHAQRAEFVSLKDCPQDAAGVVEWNRRLIYRTHWIRRHFDRGYSAAALREFQRKTGVTHMLASGRMNVPLEPVYRNGHFSVYRLSD